MDELAEAEGKTWAAGFSLGKLMEMVRDKLRQSDPSCPDHVPPLDSED